MTPKLSYSSRILLIEDNPGDADLIAEMLETAGGSLKLECYDRLSSGLDHLRSESADLVLLDLSLPDSFGLETFLKAQATAPAIPIIVLTSLDDSDIALQTIREGAQDYLPKGQISGPLLVRAIRYALERAQLARRLERLSRRLRALTKCNQAIARGLGEKELLEEICRVTCEEAGYRMAWVGYALHDKNKSIKPVAHAGLNTGYLEAIQLSWGNNEYGQGPSGKALRTGETALNQDSATSPDMKPWRDAGQERGFHASIGLPLSQPGAAQPFGVLSLYSNEPYAFTPDEVNLLEEMARDLAYGIGALREREERRRAEEELARQAQELARSNADLQRFNQLAIGRELRMIELKQQINQLARQLGQAPPYPPRCADESGSMLACGQDEPETNPHSATN